MTLNIRKNASVADFQNAFNTYFPYLKAVFFRNPMEEPNDFWANHMVLNNQILLSELSDNLPQFDEHFTFSPNITVAEFENALQSRYGLTVRVFRKHYGDLVETSNSRNLDLEGQNEKGAATSQIVEDVIL
ncbi:MAG: hypothetical protein JNL70_04625 [Saprospiraceae bacterium]|nr:hypothetical protein [Saprospiraceae bacterium]